MSLVAGHPQSPRKPALLSHGRRQKDPQPQCLWHPAQSPICLSRRGWEANLAASSPSPFPHPHPAIRLSWASVLGFHKIIVCNHLFLSHLSSDTTQGPGETSRVNTDTAPPGGADTQQGSVYVKGHSRAGVAVSQVLWGRAQGRPAHPDGPGRVCSQS